MGRLHGRLLELGHNSAIMCMDPDASGPAVHQVPRWRRLEGALRRATGPIGLNDVHRVSSWLIPRHPVFRRADVVHIHGLHGGFLSYLALPAITRAKPTVFTLHDMWALTGHCTYYLDCTRWQTGCGRCPYPDTQPAVNRDATAVEWRLKRRAYRRTDMTIVAVSRPQLPAVRAGLLRDFPLRYLPNGIDTAVFRPRPESALRQELGIPSDRLLLMFAALNLGNPIKGLGRLLDALARLDAPLRRQVSLLLVGAGSVPTVPDGLDVIPLGFVDDPVDLARAYSAADIFVSPTLGEAQGQVFLEAMAAGTPPVAFDSLGVADVVRHEKTGLLVPSGDIDGLRHGIARLAGDPTLRAALARQGRQMVEAEFSLDAQVRGYVGVYEEVHARRRLAATG